MGVTLVGLCHCWNPVGTCCHVYLISRPLPGKRCQLQHLATASLLRCSTDGENHYFHYVRNSARFYWADAFYFVSLCLMCCDPFWLSLQPCLTLHPYAPVPQHVTSHYHLMTDWRLIMHIFTPHYYKRGTITSITAFFMCRFFFNSILLLCLLLHLLREESHCQKIIKYMNWFKRREQRTCRIFLHQTWIFTFILSKRGQNLDVVFF